MFEFLSDFEVVSDSEGEVLPMSRAGLLVLCG